MLYTPCYCAGPLRLVTIYSFSRLYRKDISIVYHPHNEGWIVCVPLYESLLLLWLSRVPAVRLMNGWRPLQRHEHHTVRSYLTEFTSAFVSRL